MDMATRTDRYRLLGGPASPYSLKLRAVLRYRRIPHNWLVPRGFFLDSPELVQAGKRFLPVLQYPEDGSYHADSTPLIYALERRHPLQRSVVPAEADMALIAHLIETFADEWLVYTMFEYKWRRVEDASFCGQRQILGWLGPLDDAPLQAAAQRFAARQTEQLSALGVDGSSDLEATYLEVLEILDEHLKTHPFLMGPLPCLADFGLFGPLCQLAIDPTASQLMRARSLRVFQWVQLLDDASGLEGDGPMHDGHLPPAVRSLLRLCGELLLPMLVAQHEATLAEADEATFAIRGRRQTRARNRYQSRCLLWLRAEVAALQGDALDRARATLKAANCWQALQLAPGDAALVPPFEPR